MAARPSTSSRAAHSGCAREAGRSRTAGHIGPENRARPRRLGCSGFELHVRRLEQARGICRGLDRFRARDQLGARVPGRSWREEQRSQKHANGLAARRCGRGRRNLRPAGWLVRVLPGFRTPDAGQEWPGEFLPPIARRRLPSARGRSSTKPENGDYLFSFFFLVSAASPPLSPARREGPHSLPKSRCGRVGRRPRRADWRWVERRGDSGAEEQKAKGVLGAPRGGGGPPTPGGGRFDFVLPRGGPQTFENQGGPFLS